MNLLSWALCHLVHIQSQEVMMFLIHLPLCFCMGKFVFATRETHCFVSLMFTFRSSPAISPLCCFHFVLTSVSAANYIRPCYIHQPLGSSFHGTVNTPSCRHTCTRLCSAFTPQFRRSYQAGLTDWQQNALHESVFTHLFTSKPGMAQTNDNFIVHLCAEYFQSIVF